MARFCTKCGSENDAAAKFCEQCGAPLPSTATTNASPKVSRSPTSVPNNQRPLLVTLGVLGLMIAGALAWHFLNPNRPSERLFQAVLNEHYAKDKVLSEGLSCLNNTQYGRNPIYANPWDNRMKEWMGLLVASGLYAGPEQVTSGGYFPREQHMYQRTEIGARSIREGKLCFADGIRVGKIISFTTPQNSGGRDATVVSYAIEFVNQADWSKNPELQAQLSDKLGTDAINKQATLVRGEKAWEWSGDGNRLAQDRTDSTSTQSASGGGGFSRISNWFSGLFSTSPDTVLKNFYGAVERGNFDDAVNSMSSQSVAMMGKEKLRAMLKHENEKIQAQGGIKSIETETKVDGDNAQVKAVIKYNNGREKTERSRLIKENGKWKLGS